MSTKTTKRPTQRELDPEDMTMHDIVWMFLSTGLLASGQFDMNNSVIKHGKKLADEFLAMRTEEESE